MIIKTFNLFIGLQNSPYYHSGSNIDRVFFGVPPVQLAALLLAGFAFAGVGAQLGAGDLIDDIISKKLSSF